MFTDKVNYVDNLQSYLIRWITDVDLVLCDLWDRELITEEQYNTMKEKTTSQEKMRELCDVISHWEDPGKYAAYTVLRKYNAKTVKDLEKFDMMKNNAPAEWLQDLINFIDRHRFVLIRTITCVDPVLRDLWERDLLTEDQYNDVMEKTTSEKKMRELCDIIRRWEDTGKYMGYTVLRKYNEKIIRDLELKDWMRRKDPSGCSNDIVNIIDHQRSVLIRRITNVDPVLRDLREQDLLTEDQYNDVMEKTTSEEKMEHLCDIISHWMETKKCTAYNVLLKYNKDVFEDLTMKERNRGMSPSGSSSDKVNFINHHRSALVRRITDVYPVLADLLFQRILTEEQYIYLNERPTSQEKMRELCDIVSRWEDSDKYTAYTVLRKYNEEIIEDIEIKNWVRSNAATILFREKVTFIDHHQLNLIRRITDVDPFLHDLRGQDLLTEEQYNDVMEKTTSEEKMRKLCDIISHWEDIEKYVAHNILRKFHEEIIKDLKMMDWKRRHDLSGVLMGMITFTDRHQSVLVSRISNVHPILHDLWDQNLLNEEQYNEIMRRTTSQEKMRELCDVISHWEDPGKFIAYTVLRKYNEKIIEDLEMAEWMRRVISAGSFIDKVNYVDNLRSYLIRWIIDVDLVLCDLRDRELITEEQYNAMKEKTTSQEKMRELCDVISHWEDPGKYVAYTVFRKYNEKIIENLEHYSLSSQTFPAEWFHDPTHFIEYYQSALIRRITDVDSVLHNLRRQDLLTGEQFNDVIEKTTSKEKMRKLCDIIRLWDDTEKNTACTVLKEYNDKIIRDLEMKEWMRRNDPSGCFIDMIHFLEYYQPAFIRRISDVDSVLCDLRGRDLLTEEQFNDAMEKTTSKEKMRKLCDIISHWEDPGKYTAYTILRKYNTFFIQGLETMDRMRRNDPSGSSMDHESFRDYEQPVLIRKIRDLHPVLHDLFLQYLLTEEEYKVVMGKRTSREKMEELCGIISHWEDIEKCMAYTVLRKYKEVTRDVEREDWWGRGNSRVMVNVIDRRRRGVIKKIKAVDPVVWDLQNYGLLTEEQINDVMEETTSEEKMRKLCDIIKHWDNLDKRTACEVLRIYNEKTITDLEMVDRFESYGPLGLCRDKINFVNCHLPDLFRRITDVESVLNDLQDPELLPEEQYNVLMEKETSYEKMHELCDIISHWEDTGKFTAYNVLREHNEEIIRDLEMEDWMKRRTPSGSSSDKIIFIDLHRSFLIRRITVVDPVLCDLWNKDLLSDEQYNDVMSKETSKEKMRELCDINSHWENSEKYTAYTVLRKYNEDVIIDLEMMSWMRSIDHPLSFTDMVNFIDCHRPDLIRWITNIDSVLHYFWYHDLLTEEQYNDLMRKTTSQEKMRKLCDLISHWEDTGKYTAYNIFREHNEEIIKGLEMVDGMNKSDPSGRFRDMVNFTDCHQSSLVRRITDIDPVLHDLLRDELLTEEQYNDMVGKATSQEMMEELCDIIRYWKDTEKFMAYVVLRKYNEDIIRDLEIEDWIRINNFSRSSRDKVNCIDLHRSDLIRWIRVIDPILRDLLDQDLLTQKQSSVVMEKMTSWEKMEELCNIISHWKATEKCVAYTALREYNGEIIKALETEDWMRRNDPSESFRDSGNFIDNNQYDLIRRVTCVDPVLCVLRDQGLLTEDQYNDVMEKTTSEQKMEELCEIITKWKDTGKYTAHTVLQEYNEEIIRDVELKDWMWRNDPSGCFRDIINFVIDYQWDLVENITNVDPVLRDLLDQDLLTEEQFNDAMEKTTCRKKMRKLCYEISYWEDTEKYTAYTVLRKYNEKIIEDMAHWMRKKYLSESFSDIRNVIDNLQSDLIRRITNVDPVLCDLEEENLLTEEEYNDLMEKTTSEEKMKQLCDIISHWEDFEEKRVAYYSLRTYNEEIIRDLLMEDWTRRNDPSVTINETSQETEDLQMSRAKMTVDNISCNLCGKEQESAEVVDAISTTDGSYRLELKSPGLYRCQKTGIKFFVRGPVIIEYKVDSWSHYFKNIPDNTYEILGPLFNIRTSGDPRAVSAVHLPHYLCLKSFTDHRALIKCAQFKEGKITLLTPTRINPFYILLENPRSSHLGVILSSGRNKIAIHGKVLIYLTILDKGDPAEEYRIHLYVLPNSRNVKEFQILDEIKLKDGYLRINKPQQINDPVQKNIKYRVTGYPEVTVHPQTVMFQSESHHYTEIQLEKTDNDIFLYVSEERTRVEVWDTRLTRDDIKKVAQLLPELTSHGGGSREHFVDRCRKYLIDNISSVAEVLDDLKQHKLLTNESYDKVLSKCTSRDQMREIYRYVGSWNDDDKDIFYQALERHNPSTMKKLKRL